MNRRGVCYDVGRVMWGQSWRPEFSPDETRRELQIIHDDLHCNAVRICGQDIDRLLVAGQAALDRGLEVWLSPELWDHTPEQTVDYIVTAAEAARHLHQQQPGRVVLSVGSEATLFMAGIVEGGSVFERLERPDFWQRIQTGEHNEPLNAFLADATARTRRVFDGPLTYASIPLETVDWSRFDIVGLDLYRDARIRDRFADLLRRWFAFDLPVAITEFGCCTYQGAADAGARGFAILDTSDRDASPARLDGDYTRDEDEQARELTETLSIFDAAGVDATFVMTFVDPLHPYSDDPHHDLDMASYSLVKSFGTRLGPNHPDAPWWDRHRLGTSYPDMPWDPKRSFTAVADYYATNTEHV
ncbi:hypothetical protein [Nocardia sp. R6R-6]|uniref:hypothetical protein n=1 Tax=Nocardia sp. R6R-6 TaxID=3459303 RepID=UPI00403DF7D7